MVVPDRKSPCSSHLLEQGAIEGGEPLLLDLSSQPSFDLTITSWTEVQADDLGGAFTHAMAEVLAGDDQVLAAVVLAAQDDMGVGMAGVVVVDRHPVELRPEVLFHLLHQPPREVLEVGVFDRVLGRDDEPELMAVTLAAPQEGIAVGPVVGSIVEVAGQALARDAVALQVAQMRSSRGCAPPGELDHARLDDDAAAGGRRRSDRVRPAPGPRPRRGRFDRARPARRDKACLRPPARATVCATSRRKALRTPRLPMRPSFGSNSWPWMTGSFMETSATTTLVRNRLLAWRLRPQPNQGLVVALEEHWRPSLHKNRCADKNLATVGGSLLSCLSAIVTLSTIRSSTTYALLRLACAL